MATEKPGEGKAPQRNQEHGDEHTQLGCAGEGADAGANGETQQNTGKSDQSNAEI